MKNSTIKSLTILVGAISGGKLGKARRAFQAAFGDSVLPASFDWNLNPQAANKLFLKPIFASSNPLTEIFSVMRNVKVDATMYYLGHPSKIIQRNDDCEFTPKGTLPLTQRKMNVYRAKINMQQCNDEFFDTCLEYALGSELDIFDPNQDNHIRRLKAAMLSHIQIATVNDMLKLSLYGDRTLADAFYNVTDGAYKFIDEAVVAGDITEIAAGSGAPYAAGAVPTILTSMHKNSDRVLRNIAPSQKMFLVDEESYDNLKEYFQALGTEEAHRILRDGIPTGEYSYDGVRVKKVPELGYIQTDDFAAVNPHRIIYTTDGNLKLGTDIRGKSAKFRVYLDLVHKKTWFYDAAFKLGGNYAHNELMTVAK